MKTRKQPILRTLAAALSVLALTTPLSAACGGSGPGATLLFPYFEVDAEGHDGRTTLISVQSSSPRPHLTHVVLWSNCAVPVLDFDLYLGPYELRSIDLRSLLFAGLLPASDPRDEAPPGCGSPLALPDFDPATLRQQLSGAPVGEQCYAAAIGDRVVTGYLTVDVVRECSPSVRTPYDEGYFGEGGLAGDENVLAGEIFLLDSPGDSAQGLSAVSLRAEAEGGETSFYRHGDNRQGLPAVHQAHYLNGGAFDGGTDLLYWIDQSWSFPDGEAPAPWSCARPEAMCPWSGGHRLVLRGRDEAGRQPAKPDSAPQVSLRHQSLRAGRLGVGEDVPVAVSFGTLEACLGYEDVHDEPPPRGQSWILPVHTAEGRYSAGLQSVGLCPDDLPRHPLQVEVPPWLRDVILGFECEPAAELSREIVRYTYDGESVYLFPFPTECCDRWQSVYDENGEFVCAPAGGISGQGDFQCPDFFADATDETLVWRDPRPPEQGVNWP